MYRMKLHLCAAALCFLLASCGLPISGSGSLATTSSAKAQALVWLNQAKINTSASAFYNSITQVRNILNSTPIVLEYPTDGGACSDDVDGITLAYVDNPPEESDIYMCSEALTYSNKIVAQVLIHESIHITGNTNECATSYIEAHIVHFAGEQPFENAYIEDCPLTYDFSDISFSTSSDSNRVFGWNPIKLDPRIRY